MSTPLRRERMCGGAKIASGCDLVLFSKFGKLETMRAGLSSERRSISAAGDQRPKKQHKLKRLSYLKSILANLASCAWLGL